jgi:hypothetical protein
VSEAASDFEDLPAIVISSETLAEILALSAASRGVFSCNARGDVWAATKRGRSSPSARTYLDLAALDEIVGLVLRAWPTGGRFRVTREGIRLVGTGEALFTFDVAGASQA